MIFWTPIIFTGSIAHLWSILRLNIAAVEDVLVYSKSRLKVIPTQDFERDIIVSREKVAAFKDWFNGFNG